MRRRSFLTLLGMAPFGLPVAAKEATAAAAAASVNAAIGSAAMAGMDVAQTSIDSYAGMNSHTQALLALDKAGLLPSWFAQSLVDESYHGQRIDPSFACLRSVSVQHRFAMTKEHMKRKAVDQWRRNAVASIAQNEFYSGLKG